MSCHAVQLGVMDPELIHMGDGVGHIRTVATPCSLGILDHLDGLFQGQSGGKMGMVRFGDECQCRNFASIVQCDWHQPGIVRTDQEFSLAEVFHHLISQRVVDKIYIAPTGTTPIQSQHQSRPIH